MSQKKSFFIYGLICIIIMIAVTGIYCWQMADTEPLQPAENCDQLELYIKFSSGTERVHIWKSEDGMYYFFLPAGAKECKVTFGNLADGDNVCLDGETFAVKDDLRVFLDSLSSNQAVELIMKAGGQEQKPVDITFLQSENVAAMFIDTASGSVDNIHADKEVKEAASMRLADSEGNICYSGSMEYIKSRGNSTWNYDKKPYQIKLNKDAELLNMPAAKKWILLANVIDDTLMKNEVVFRYAEKYTDVPTVKGQFVDLYINGDYLGNYYLCEKIEVSEHRLDITNLEAATEAVNYDSTYNEASLYVSEGGNIRATKGLNNPADITGGYLVVHIPPYDFNEEENAFRTNKGHCYSIISPSPATVEQAEYICGIFNEMETAMAQEDGINPLTGKHFSEYLDLDSWAAKYVMEEVFHDPDSVTESMYMYKDSDSIDPLIHAGPMWDYDRALGSYGMNMYSIDDAKQVGNYGIYVKQLMTFEEVASLVYKKFEEEMVPYVENKARADIYEINQQIKASADMDAVRWNQVHGYYVDRDAGVDYLSYFLEEKKNYLLDVWLGEEDYCTVTFLGYDGIVYKTYRVKKGERFTEVPSISTYVAVFDGWYVQGENIPYISGLPILSDVTYESHWIGMDIIIQNGLNMSDMELSQVDPQVFEDIAQVLREMRKAQEEENSTENDDIQQP